MAIGTSAGLKIEKVEVDGRTYYQIHTEPKTLKWPQLSRKELAAPTSELIEMILNSECMRFHIGVMSNLDYINPDYFHIWKSEFNGCAELEKRDDAVRILYETYLADFPEDSKIAFSTEKFFIRNILLSNEFVGKLTEEQIARLRK